MSELHIAVVIFVITYSLIMSDRIDKTTAALTGGMAMVAFKILDSEHAFDAIDLNVIFLLAGMMIIANMMASTGVFEWLAIRSAQSVNGNPVGVVILLCAITAVGSALLDNVTTVVLVAPVTILVAQTLRLNPVPILIGEVLASNIGGTSTLIGDPPNILIGSYADIDFLTFLTNVGPIALICIVVFLVSLKWLVGDGPHRRLCWSVTPNDLMDVSYTLRGRRQHSLHSYYAPNSRRVRTGLKWFS